MANRDHRIEWGLYWVDQNKLGWVGADKKPFAFSEHPISKAGVAYVENRLKTYGDSETYTCARFLWNGKPLARAQYDRATGKLTLIKDTNPEDRSKVFNNLQEFVDFVLSA